MKFQQLSAWDSPDLTLWHPYTNAYIGSNGYMELQRHNSECLLRWSIAAQWAAYPASIFFGQKLEPNILWCMATPLDSGAPGSQIFVVDFNAVPHYYGPLT